MRPLVARTWATLGGLVLLGLMLLTTQGLIAPLSGFYQRLELLVYDQRMQAHLPAQAQPATAAIVIVDLDEASLHQYGRWPWSRALIAQLTQALTQAGAAVIGFDVLFGEPERNPVTEIIHGLGSLTNRADLPFNPTPALTTQLSQLTPHYAYDAQFAQTLATSEAVLGYIFHNQTQLTSGLLPPPLELNNSTPELTSQLILPNQTGYAAPLPELIQQAKSAGFFSLQPDLDGVVRRAPLLAKYADQLYPSLALEMLRQFMFLDSIQLHTATIAGQEHLEALQLADNFFVPTDSLGQVLIPYRGPEQTFPYLSAGQLLDTYLSTGQLTNPLLEGALVLIGTSAPGLLDLRATPLDAAYPGVEVHANLLAALLDKKFLQQPAWAPGANFVLALLTGLILALALPWLSAVRQLMLSLVLTLLLLALTSWFWLSQGIVLALAAPVLLVTLSLAIFNLVWGFVYESKTRNRLAFMFGQYVPPQIVAQMSRNPAAFNFAGEERELSVLFSDIRGFTSLSERLSAAELKNLLNSYFTPITGIIFEHQGTIDKYIGDLVMAFWGAPVADADHALHSIQAAHKMLAATQQLSQEFMQAGWPAISIGIGINSGLMNVGDMGSEYRRAYTVLGDAVNLASRLESSTKYYGVDLIVGQRTQELAQEHFIWRELDLVKVKGKAEPIKIYQPLLSTSAATPELLAELKTWQTALAAFRKQDLATAKPLITQLHKQQPEVYTYQQYLERINQLEQEPLPDTWDGSWTRTEK